MHVAIAVKRIIYIVEIPSHGLWYKKCSHFDLAVIFAMLLIYAGNKQSRMEEHK